MKNFVFASYGNDSVALIQLCHENNLHDVTVIYSDTGWASDEWNERVVLCEAWVRTLGFNPARTQSEGLEALVRRKKGWPRQGMQFCTAVLKIEAGMAYLDKHDPDKTGCCFVGVRREESANRAHFPEMNPSSDGHGGRVLFAPLATYVEEKRNELLNRAGFEVLPHRSMECFPCINSNRSDLRVLAKDKERIDKIAAIEKDMGYTSKGKPRTMFRPYRHMDAIGIREVVRWACSERGEFDPSDGLEMSQCESGWCAI